MTKISDLQRGDIILIRHNGKPYHVAIYAPNSDYIGDVIHMGSGFKRSGAIRGTLSSMYHLHSGLNQAGNFFGLYSNTLDVQVIRSKKLNGEAIAEQAERWMLQGVVYDEKRLMDTLEGNKEPHDISLEAQTVNVFEYLKYAARRNIAPIKTPYFPYTSATFLSGFASFFLAPSMNLFRWLVNFALRVIRYATNTENQQETRIKGFNCAGFVLACVGAVALKDDIQELKPEQGWVSLKYGNSPEDKNSAYAKALKIMQDKKGIQDGSRPGLHTLLTDEQIQNFDIEGLKDKLGGLALLHPHKPGLCTFMDTVLNNAEFWTDLGVLDREELETEVSALSKPFNREQYHAEKAGDFQKTQENHEEFGRAYGNAAFEDRTYLPLSFFKKTVAKIADEPISELDCIDVIRKD